MTPSATLSLARARTTDIDAARRGLALGIALIGLALPALMLLQYALPPQTDAHYWGLNPEGMHQFQEHWGLQNLPTIGVDSFSLAFRLLLVTLWSGYALLVLSVLQGAKLAARPILTSIIGAAVCMALFCPPLLSHDVYAYAVHGRLFALYGQNPYLCRPEFLKAIGDPASHFITWNWPTVYGPVWTRIEIVTVALMHRVGLWPQVIALKLVQAGALIGMALAGKRIARHLCPGRENLTLLAIGLNPLLLLEGPGSGHNDLLLVSLLLIGAMFYLDKKYLLAALCLGLSVGIKLITLAVLPWVLMEYGRGRPGRQKLAALAVAISLILLPLIICYGHLWSGAATLASLQQRSLYGLSAAELARNAQWLTWLHGHGVGITLASALVSLSQNWLILALYASLTLWLWRRTAVGNWLLAWALLAAGLMFFAMGLPFPWYIAWFWPVCLLRWDRFHLTLSGACFGLSLAWTAGYGIVCQVR